MEKAPASKPLCNKIFSNKKHPQGIAGPSNAKAARPSGVKISEVEEEEEEYVEATEKVQESKITEVEEVENNDEKEKSAEEA
ncbi:hypothetical protein GH714_002979 [Hevea brasiliensis]|uniref:Uncharacterized protein n=1 Tax=Hevea brasiliensis TaxID=3981 RepID=A0A6A6K513_HEVBR|nr:hypothetical protein GH714_002979 [Hevea brasiliensis]